MVFLLFLFVFIFSCFQAVNRLLITKAAAVLKHMICDNNKLLSFLISGCNAYNRSAASIHVQSDNDTRDEEELGHRGKLNAGKLLEVKIAAFQTNFNL